MRLGRPILRDENLGFRLRSLRIFLFPAVLAVALYAFYGIGNYRERDIRRKSHLHGGIYGVVLNDNQHPVAGATVTISFTSVEEPVPDAAPPTDKEGRFYLPDLPAGRYILQATAEGFDMQTQLAFVEEGKTAQIRIPLYRPRPPETYRHPNLLR